MKKRIAIITLGIIASSVAGLKAADSQIFQASLTPDIAINSRTTEIDGLSLSVWGENPLKGFALGFVNGSTGNSTGFTVGLVNYSESYNGVSWGLININTASFVGWQDGLINVAQGEFSGFQSAWIMNYSKI